MANGSMMTRLLIPGGFRAANEQTPAVQALMTGARATTPRKKRRTKKRPAKKRATTRAAPKRAGARKKKPARLVKGSAAAKRHMAKLRKMQKR